MEGIEDADPRGGSGARSGGHELERREWRLVGRWLVFLFAISLISISVIALTLAALPLR